MATVTLGSMSVGSVVRLKVDGVLRNFIIIHHGRPSAGYDQSCDGTWILMDGVCASQKMNNNNANSNINGSIVFEYINNDFFLSLEEDIQANIKQVRIPYCNGTTVKGGTNGLLCKVFILSATEAGCVKTSGVDPTKLGVKLDYFIEGNEKNSNRIAYFEGENTPWWTRSPPTGSTSSLYIVFSGGFSHSLGTANEAGIRPAFILPNSMVVSDIGPIYSSINEYPPTMPEKITIPGTILSNSGFTIRWSQSIDAENGLAGYVLERSINGGASWTKVYKGKSLNAYNSVPFGTETVMYRVKSYDVDGFPSDYRTSNQITVINNTAPSAPASITVPNTVLGGQSVVVTWGAATDPDGDAVTYALERQIDGGDWAQIYTGGNLSFTDPITRGWTSVAYRVKAVDSRSASGPYATSPTRTVNNNLAPTVTCSQASGTDLGTKNTGFSIDYSISDPDGDTVTVKEAIDGEVKRTFTATPGTTYTFQVTGETFMKVLNGDHTLTITANDTKMDTVHKLLFKKEVTAAMITLTAPVEADAKIAVCVLSVNGSIPADANFKVEVTNNGLDTSPIWEDCTTAVKTGTNHVFTNNTQLSGWAFNFKVTVSRGASGQGGYINSVQGGFQ